MHEIVIVSGKGGTGKTTVTAALAHLAKNKVVCDLDVDAPDLHILLEPRPRERHDFISGHEAVIDPEACQGCGTCAEMCRFDAVTPRPDGTYVVDPIRCEGCKVCVSFCPAQAIDFPDCHCGTWQVSDTRMGPMVHAQLFPGQENSGKLVTLLKRRARQLAEEQGLDLILCDGAPGIGCPVISSLAQTNLAVAVTEPTPSGRHDLERVVELCGHFRVPMAVILNKHDLNRDEARRIEELCRERGHPVVARLPHDQAVTRAMVARRVLTEEDCALADEIRRAWDAIRAILADNKDN